MRAVRETFWNLGSRFGRMPSAVPTGRPGDRLGKSLHPTLGPGRVQWGVLGPDGLVTSPFGAGRPPAPFAPSYGLRWTTVVGPLYDVATGALQTRESILESGLHFPGTLHKPPPEIVEWAWAERVSLSASWDGLSAAKADVQVGTGWWHYSGAIPSGFVDEPETEDDGDGHPANPPLMWGDRPWPPRKWRRYAVGDSIEAPTESSEHPSVRAVALASEADFAGGVAARAGVRDGEGSDRTTGGRSVRITRSDEVRGAGGGLEMVEVPFRLFPYSAELPGWVVDLGSGRGVTVAYTGLAHYYEHYRAWASPILTSGLSGDQGVRGVLETGSYGWILAPEMPPEYADDFYAAAEAFAAEHYVPASVTLAAPAGQARFKSSPGPLPLAEGWEWGDEPSVSVKVEAQLARVLEEGG